MAGGKQTPRQRMMGILYLVLLGLIALDVPESLVEAFKAIGDSLNASKTNVQKGIDNTFTAFENSKLKNEPARAKPPYDRAKQASTVHPIHAAAASPTPTSTAEAITALAMEIRPDAIGRRRFV